VMASNAAGVTAEATRTVVLDTQAPVIGWAAPFDSAITKQAIVDVSGSITDATVVTLTLNGAPVGLTPVDPLTKSFLALEPVIDDGPATLTLVATDGAGNVATVKRTITKDATAPVITVIDPIEGSSASTSTQVVIGSVNDLTTSTLTINGVSQPIAADGGFSSSVTLAAGPNAIVIVATDAAGNSSSATRHVSFSQNQDHRLRVIDGGGVTFGTFLRDTILPFGTVVPYSFASKQGHDSVFVVLDDTLASRSGSIVMNQDRVIEVAADTIYTIGGLSTGAQGAVTRIQALLTAADKAAAYRELFDFTLKRALSGDVATLLRDNSLAWYLTVDPVRDSAAIDAVNAALNGVAFGAYVYPGRTYFMMPPFRSTAFIGKDPGLIGIAPARLSAPPPAQLAVIPDWQRESPLEYTTLTFVNGIFTDPGDPLTMTDGAYLTESILVAQATSYPRFANGRTLVTHVYNATRSVELQEYDRVHPCTRPTMRELFIRKPLISGIRYAACKGVRFERRIASIDLVESVTQRIQLLLHLPPTTPAVDAVVSHVKQHRTQWSEHNILIGHSQGNLVTALAMRQLPAREGHPLQVAPACLATVALASPTPKSAFDLEEPYKKGFTVDGDIIRATLSAGWPIISTPFSEAAKARAEQSTSPLTPVIEGVTIHKVNESYLGDPTASALVWQYATELHKECLTNELRVTPLARTVQVGEEFEIEPIVINQNGNRIHGRELNVLGNRNLTPIGTRNRYDTTAYRFVINTPRETPQSVTVYGRPLNEYLTVTVPLVPVSGVSVSERDSSWYVSVAGYNGGLGISGVQTPEGDWDGAEGTCGTIKRVYGSTGPSGTAWGDFELHCIRRYTATRGVVTHPIVLPQVTRYEHRWVRADEDPAAAGWYTENDTLAVCGAKVCIKGVIVRAVDQTNSAVATSSLVSPAMLANRIGPTSPVRPQAAIRRPASPSVKARQE
jgi:hypothetical protein